MHLVNKTHVPEKVILLPLSGGIANISDKFCECPEKGVGEELAGEALWKTPEVNSTQRDHDKNEQDEVRVGC